MRSTEQGGGVLQITNAVGQLDKAAQLGVAQAEESSAAADNLQNQALHMVQTVAVFQLAA